MSLSPEVLREIEACAIHHGVVLVDLVVRGHGRTRSMECFIDNEDGITPRHCTELSRGILDILSRLEAERSYHLVVSSPGLDRPLSMPWQYKKHVGRTFRIRRRVPAGEETLTGTLVKFDTQGITLSGGRGNMELSVLFEDVLEARVVTPW